MSGGLVWDTPGVTPASNEGSTKNNKATAEPIRKLRRRKWTRRRILVDYPYASERTQQYLRLLAENAKLSVTVDKVSDQLVETKLKLTETEEKLAQTKADLLRSRQDVSLAKSKLSALGVDTKDFGSPDLDGKNNPLQEFLSKNEQVNQIGSKISQWVQSARKGSEDMSTTGNGADAGESAAGTNTADAVRENRKRSDSASSTGGLDALMNKDTNGSSIGSRGFDWKKVGRGALLERMSQSGSPSFTRRKRVSADSSDGMSKIDLSSSITEESS